jgi:hypothetical protein
MECWCIYCRLYFRHKRSYSNKGESTCNFALFGPVLRDENDSQQDQEYYRSKSGTTINTMAMESTFSNSKSTNTRNDDAYEYTYYPNEDNGQEAELETVKTSTTINTKRTSPHNNKFRLMTINSVTFVKTKIAIMMIRNLQMQRSTKISFQNLRSNKRNSSVCYIRIQKTGSRWDVSGDKADDDKIWRNYSRWQTERRYKI